MIYKNVCMCVCVFVCSVGMFRMSMFCFSRLDVYSERKCYIDIFAKSQLVILD